MFTMKIRLFFTLMFFAAASVFSFNAHYSGNRFKPSENRWQFLYVICQDEQIVYLMSSRGTGAVIIKFCNPNYMKNCSIITFDRKVGRGVRSVSNFSVITLVPLHNNNVTVRVGFINHNGYVLKIDLKFCDFLGNSMMKLYMGMYQIYEQSPCPLLPGLLKLDNMDTSPENIPFPFPPGIYRGELDLFCTNTKDQILNIVFRLMFLPKKKRNGRKPKIIQHLK